MVIGVVIKDTLSLLITPPTQTSLHRGFCCGCTCRPRVSIYFSLGRAINLPRCWSWAIPAGTTGKNMPWRKQSRTQRHRPGARDRKMVSCMVAPRSSRNRSVEGQKVNIRYRFSPGSQFRSSLAERSAPSTKPTEVGTHFVPNVYLHLKRIREKVDAPIIGQLGSSLECHSIACIPFLL